MKTPDDIQKWQKYQKRIMSGKPRPLLVEAVTYVKEKSAALDLGAGSLNDSEFLLRERFKEVIAVDLTPQFREVAVPVLSTFSYVQRQFNEYEFPSNHFDLVSAQYVLPFNSKEDFKKIWAHIRDALKTGGIFTGQLFGTRDSWFGKPDMIFHSESEITGLGHDFEVIKQQEREYTEQGDRKKHWHYFDLILRK